MTTSAKVLQAVEQEIARQLPGLPRREFIQRALDQNGWLIQVKSLDDGVVLANRLAPEHCEVMTRNARNISERILTAGAIFLGPCSPTVLGDYVAGPSHTLPTGGAGNSFAGLTVDQFQRRTSVVEYDRVALKKSLATVKKFAELEGLEAHGLGSNPLIPSLNQRGGFSPELDASPTVSEWDWRASAVRRSFLAFRSGAIKG